MIQKIRESIVMHIIMRLVFNKMTMVMATLTNPKMNTVLTVKTVIPVHHQKLKLKLLTLATLTESPSEKAAVNHQSLLIPNS